MFLPTAADVDSLMDYQARRVVTEARNRYRMEIEHQVATPQSDIARNS
jgi:hypothetical protein